jgi:hypothetical protein
MPTNKRSPAISHGQAFATLLLAAFFPAFIFFHYLTPTARAQSSAMLVPAGATWKFLDNGTDQGTAWRAPNFDDSSWASGPAELGYGDGGEATVVSYGPSSGSKYITTYFRRAFSVAMRRTFRV